VHPAGSKSSTLDGGTPAGWRGARAGSVGCKTGCKAYAMPSPPSFRTKHGLLPSFFLFLPPYLSTVLWLLCQSPGSTPSSLLANHRSTIPEHTPFVSLFLLRSRAHAFPLVVTTPSAVGDAEEEVPGGFLPASSREGFGHQQSDRQWQCSQEAHRTQDREKLRAGIGAMERVGLSPWALGRSGRS